MINSKLYADYVELINKYLDGIPIRKLADFDECIKGLESLKNNREIPTLKNSKIQEGLNEIKDVQDNPDMYIQDRKDYPEFADLIISRIDAKLKEFRHFTIPEKGRYLKEQSKRRGFAKASQRIMKGKKPPEPGSEAHVLSQQEWLQEQGRHFSREGNTFFTPDSDSETGIAGNLESDFARDLPVVNLRDECLDALEDLHIKTDANINIVNEANTFTIESILNHTAQFKRSGCLSEESEQTDQNQRIFGIIVEHLNTLDVDTKNLLDSPTARGSGGILVGQYYSCLGDLISSGVLTDEDRSSDQEAFDFISSNIDNITDIFNDIHRLAENQALNKDTFSEVIQRHTPASPRP